MYFSPRSQQPQPKCFSTSALGYSEGIRRCLFIQEPRTGIGNCLFFGSILDIHKPPRDEAKQTRGNLYKEMYSLFDTGGQLAICGMGVQFLLIPGYLGGMLSLSFSTGNLHRGENHWASSTKSWLRNTLSTQSQKSNSAPFKTHNLSFLLRHVFCSTRC